MGRLYSISFSEVAVAAAQDLVNVTATSGMAFKVHGFQVDQRTLTSWEAKPVKLLRVPATVTPGSGGSAITPQKMNFGDAAATITARANDTTAMTTSGALSTLWAGEWAFLNGLYVAFNPDERPIIQPSQGLALNLSVAPSASTNASGTMLVEEIY
jgi:hypothetical protein